MRLRRVRHPNAPPKAWLTLALSGGLIFSTRDALERNVHLSLAKRQPTSQKDYHTVRLELQPHFAQAYCRVDMQGILSLALDARKSRPAFARHVHVAA